MNIQSYNKVVKMDNKLVKKVSELFKTISDETRISILWYLKDGPLNVGELSEKVGVSHSAVSHQLKTLRLTNLVTKTKRGREVYYEYADLHVYEIFNQAIEHVLEGH